MLKYLLFWCKTCRVDSPPTLLELRSVYKKMLGLDLTFNSYPWLTFTPISNSVECKVIFFSMAPHALIERSSVFWPMLEIYFSHSAYVAVLVHLFFFNLFQNRQLLSCFPNYFNFVFSYSSNHLEVSNFLVIAIIYLYYSG